MTRKHSRTSTDRLLTVGVGVCAVWQGCAVWQRVCCPGGVLSGGSVLSLAGAGVLSLNGGGGVLSITESDIKKQPHPPGEQNESQTGIKTLPCPKHRVKIRVVCIQVCIHV